ncbi:MAG: hypothetical protein HY861_01250 [Chlamydiia bacterium]|nr:hypothetical protein [Chlamydiia bacterium]
MLVRLGICLVALGFCLYSYLEAQNGLTETKIRIPTVDREIRLIREESRRLSYEIDRFNSPAHLIELAHRPEFGHLKHPLLKEILTVPEVLASNEMAQISR